MKIQSIILLTHKDKNTKSIMTPHLEWIKKSNPTVDIHIVCGEDSVHGKQYNWKNSDMVLRNWWKYNSNSVNGDALAVIEWDTLICTQLPELPEEIDLVGKSIFRENVNLRYNWNKKVMRNPTWKEENWYWWDEIPLLDLKSKETAVGMISFGFFIMKRSVLDNLILKKWDNLYEKSIQNELRFPTITNISGFKLGEIELPFVDWKPVRLTKQLGIYHSIKYPVDLDHFNFQ